MSIEQIFKRSSLCLLAQCLFAVAPAFAQITHVQVDLNASDLNRFGRSVSGAGDVNGDGFADLIVGASGDPFNFPSDNGNARVLSGVDGSVLYNFAGDSAGDFLGQSVSGAGDVNGDGFADLIVGAPGDDNNGSESGSARVFSGVDGSVLYTFSGDGSDDIFGGSVSGAGDVNGDGFADLIVGATGDDNNGENSGSAQVFSGADGSVLYTFNGDSAGDFLGRSASGAGDVNGDGFADLIVGATGDDNNGENSGSARVFSGADGSVLYTFDGDGSDDNRISGDFFGGAVSGAGDVNGDGFADLIVGASEDDNNSVSGGGSARVFSGLDGSVLYTFDGTVAGGRLGTSVSGAGDVNGDGFDDLIAGATFGSSNVPNAGRALVFSGVDGSVLYDIAGRSNGIFGLSVSGAEDVNGDGVDDFIVGSSVEDARLFVSQTILLGDCNLDGVVDFLDINPFIGILASEAFLEQADCNQDSTVSFLDVQFFIDILADN